ncbi:conserved Plasmodium protein, unknown function [Plasmodium relictum]|uniref:Uncharacterized protein n=1 Tax=Plasmodium relictum TaxID=85471 RepID=A0A1J1H7F5_PLARL|nr:conserved Plasmodium protein, unknown function [Plasmodium relictum]CRH00879.1 conserved Plasmodium protein, unknown function [Plasmodium relictum]
MKAGYTTVVNKIEKKISKKNERYSNTTNFFFKKKNGKNNFFTERFKPKINEKKGKNICNLNSQNNKDNSQEIINRSKRANNDVNQEEINSKSKLKEKINNKEKKIKNIKFNFDKQIKKTVPSELYFEGNSNELQNILYEDPIGKYESFPKNEIDINENLLSDNYNEKNEIESLNKKIKNISGSFKSENTHEFDSYEKFFEINNKAKYELSEHVKTLISDKNDFDIHFKKEKEIINDNQEDEYQSLNKLKTLYEDTRASTKYFLTKMLNSRIYIEKNIPLYDNILNKNTESFFKKLNIFNEEEKVDSCEQGNDFIDNICEYFTYLMSLTLIRL